MPRDLTTDGSQWEYKSVRLNILHYDSEDPKRDAILNRYGQDGWELVGVVASDVSEGSTHSVIAFFKRPL